MSADTKCIVCDYRFAKLDVPIKCDGCASLVHEKCSGLTTSEIKCVSLKKRILKYFCAGCENGLKDLPQLKLLMKKLLVEVEVIGVDNEIVPLKVIRLGRYQSDKLRPIKAVFPTSSNTFDILKNKRKLSLQVPPSRKNISSDCTLHQRDSMRKLREELAARSSNGETGLTIKLIKGVPRIFLFNIKLFYLFLK
ncbi:hypothetical protein QTP88_011816 [Uroleucon formosanum]